MRTTAQWLLKTLSPYVVHAESHPVTWCDLRYSLQPCLRGLCLFLSLFCLSLSRKSSVCACARVGCGSSLSLSQLSGWHPGLFAGSSQSHTETQTDAHSHTHRQFTVPYWPHMLVIRLWEEPEEDPHRHEENTERPPGIEPATLLPLGVPPPTPGRQSFFV